MNVTISYGLELCVFRYDTSEQLCISHYVTHTQRVSVMVRRADTEVSPHRATERLLFEFFVLNSWNEH